jgi:predicted metal-binding transcription factor (methanogenesis marker protein 9)
MAIPLEKLPVSIPFS